MTETVDLYVIARLDNGDAAADLYSCEVYYDAHDGTFHGRTVASWWEPVRLESTAVASLDELDQAMSRAGYTRVGGWRKRVTSSGAVRYFADATTGIEEL
ncbi:hypothetical protein ACFWPK_31875 [Nocardia sp. NPDC058519]|uniref:hypothetical protein n=1 Tax=Nocardia sp. NPDC058519 TaxID=3346535 RepID=UPI003663002C